MWCKRWCSWTCRVGQKNPTLTFNVVRNLTPTPPKNLQLLITLALHCNPDDNSVCFNAQETAFIVSRHFIDVQIAFLCWYTYMFNYCIFMLQHTHHWLKHYTPLAAIFRSGHHISQKFDKGLKLHKIKLIKLKYQHGSVDINASFALPNQKQSVLHFNSPIHRKWTDTVSLNKNFYSWSQSSDCSIWNVR